MLRDRRKFRGRLLALRATSALVCCAFCVLAIGIPLPAPPDLATAEVPYPCQHGRCGCRTAEQCWKACCCRTNRDKLAWAREHGVTPPSYVIAAAEREAEIAAPRSCCASRSPAKRKPSSCCEQPSKSAVTWTSGLEARRCRGEAPTWLNVPISLPPQAPLRTASPETCVRPLSAIAEPQLLSISFAPPDPPPRIV